MASKNFYVFLIFLAHSQPYALVNGNTTLIKNTCRNTKYYDLCFSSLKSSPASQKNDPKSLATIMLGIGIANATSTSSYLSSQFLGTSNDTTLKRVLKECAHKYTYAGEALQASAQDLANEVYDYAYMHITAASDYPNACHNLFKVHHGLVYPSEVALREDGFKHICDVALGIVDNLSW